MIRKCTAICNMNVKKVKEKTCMRNKMYEIKESDAIFYMLCKNVDSEIAVG